jgi:hypothetical protein
MIGHATSPFTVDHFEEHGTEVLPGARVSKARIAKTFTGDVDGTGVVVADPLAQYRRSRRASSFAIKLDNPPLFERHVSKDGIVTGIPASCVKLVA